MLHCFICGIRRKVQNTILLIQLIKKGRGGRKYIPECIRVVLLINYTAQLVGAALLGWVDVLITDSRQCQLYKLYHYNIKKNMIFFSWDKMKDKRTY